jgi:hypothetical protein
MHSWSNTCMRGDRSGEVRWVDWGVLKDSGSREGDWDSGNVLKQFT